MTSLALPLPLAAPEEIGLSSVRLARVGAVMRGEIERGRVPGAVALVARRGRLAFFESFGQRDPASGAPMAKDTIFRIYSMTKPITSVAAMMLWEEGRFLLGDPIAKYLPDLAGLQVAVARGGEIEQVPVDFSAPRHCDLEKSTGTCRIFCAILRVLPMSSAVPD